MAEFITNAEGNFFVQDEAAEEFAWLTCTGVGDIDVPKGDLTKITEQDPLQSGRFKIAGTVRGAPGAGTYTLTKPLAKVYNYLVERNCAFQGRINWVCRGSRQDPTNYELAVLMLGSEATGSRIIAPVAQEQGAEARVNTEMNVSFDALTFLYQLRMAQVAVTNTEDALAMSFLTSQCEDRCGPGFGMCEYGIIGMNTAGAYATEVKITRNAGVTFAATAADPFLYGGAVGAALTLLTITGPQLIVFRGSTVVGYPAEVSVSDDHGATWTDYLIGGVNGDFINAAALNGANIFAVGTGGQIFKSTDSGVTWTTVEDGAGGALNSIAFADENVGYAVGAGNVFLTTDDGGATWAVGTGPAVGEDLLAVAVNSKGHVFVGSNAGAMYVSEDVGVTWETRVDLGSGSIDWIAFDADNHYVGAMIWNTAAPVGYLYRSENNGAAWRRVSGMPVNSGLHTGHICDVNHIYVAGAAHGGTTFIAKALPVG
jgi:hypothetical protein